MLGRCILTEIRSLALREEDLKVDEAVHVGGGVDGGVEARGARSTF